MGWSVTIPINSGDTARQLDNTHGRVVRTSLYNTDNATQHVVYLYDGTSNEGVLLDVIALSPLQSTRDYYRAWEYPFDGGLFYTCTGAGAIVGAIVVRHTEPGESDGEPVIIVGDLTVNVDTAGA